MERSAIRGRSWTRRNLSFGQAHCSMLQVRRFSAETSEFLHSAANQAPDVARLNAFQFVKKPLVAATQ